MNFNFFRFQSQVVELELGLLNFQNLVDLLVIVTSSRDTTKFKHLFFEVAFKYWNYSLHIF